MSQNHPSTVPPPGQTVQIVPQQLPSGNSWNGKLKLLSIVLSILFGITVIVTLTSSDVLAHSALGLCITAAVVGIIIFASFAICRYSGRSPSPAIQSGTIQTVPQQNTGVLQYPGNIPTGYPLPPQCQNMAPGSLSATYTYTPLNSSTAGSNNSYVGKKDFCPPGFPSHTPTTGAASSASYAPYPPTSASFPTSPEYQPPPSFVPGFSPTSYHQAPPYGQMPATGPTIGAPSASAPEFDPPPPYAPPPYEK
ncbi:DNA-directed RNA polymerase II subunit RPB1-like [Penaeus chinensis]|uniref:DNA-directed RNA polymerase II subunit RPB1-like n=1 Tax=Penaeus chinensis TaxID=139456 RepID=UPI001FB59C61|nr:DNA-directed RNA polymerase II subunit RPB1-like [Penaeus chinensis]XP_047497537.1 DNA-directed RNA polymerase II subunit RPB1-like [Penaeus chinensis]